MDLAALAPLVLLALVDSTSFGTLLIPIWLMLAPGRLRPGRIIVFLATVAAFYLVLGLALVAGLDAFSEQLSDAFDTKPAQVVQLLVGVGLLVAAFRLPGGTSAGESGRFTVWRERAVGEDGSTGGLMALAVTAAVIEAASMLPYLVAIGLIGAADLSWPSTVLVLAGYCLVMILPALVLLAVRIRAATRVEPVLQRINGWMVRNGPENTAWIVGLVGFYVAATALNGLGVLDQIDSWSKG
ncbi:GAP family protein [Aeromicrobium panaciterrae]|uniref:GAP family protein n=1 Tax=Aeromicrobium panaciterrae TaxID=363861 RepID=UPI0031CDB9A4